MSRHRRSPALLFSGLLLALALVCAAALRAGQVGISWGEIARLLIPRLSGDDVPPGLRLIILDLRLPRILLAVSVGASLAAAGTVYQGLLRNPLADPFLLGLSGGAALGASVVIMGGAAALHPLFVPAAAFAGAVGALVVVHRLAAGARSPSTTTLILAGVVVSAFCSSLVMFLNAVSPSARVHGALFWMMGSLAAPPPGMLPLAAAAAGAGVLLLTLAGGELNALSMGEETAAHLGVDTGRARWRLLLIASLVTATAVAASGLIGFVGLIVPHALRTRAGADHRLLVPAAAVGGAALLVLADTGARSLFPPAEIPVGVITALVGAPFFLVLLRRTGGWMG